MTSANPLAATPPLPAPGPSAWLRPGDEAATAGPAAYERAMLFFALVAPWRPPPPAEDAFTLHRRSSYGVLVAGLLGVLVIESVAIHLLFVRFDLAPVAWALTVSSASVALWLMADFQAMRRLPPLLDANGLDLRVGLRWRARVPLAAIAWMRRLGPAEARPKGALRAAVGRPSLLLGLSRPVEALGPFNLRRTVSELALGPDDVERFEAALRALRGGSTVEGGGAVRDGRSGGTGLAGVAVAAALLACGGGPPAAATPSITSDVPAAIDPAASYLIYLHGRIVEGDDERPTHPRFGVYDFPAIRDAFAAAGFHVIAEHRAADADVGVFADKVLRQVRALLAAGVPPERVAVVGFSKGGGIAIRASTLLADDRVPFVFLGACGGIDGANAPVVHGRLLSVFESSDEIGTSCAPLFARAAGPVTPREIEISTGEAHGAFYRPRRDWLDPVVAFLKDRKSNESTR